MLMAWCWCGSNLVPGGRVDLHHLVAVQGLGQLAQAWRERPRALFHRGIGHADGGLQAVFDRQHAVGKGLDGEFARLADTSSSARRRTFSALGLGTQEGVGHLACGQLQLGKLGNCGDQARGASLTGAAASGWVDSWVGGAHEVQGNVRRTYDDWTRRPLGPLVHDFKRVFEERCAEDGSIVDAGAPAVPVGQLAPVALGRPAMLVQLDLAAERLHDLVADGQAQARAGAHVTGEKGWNRRSASSGAMPGPLSAPSARPGAPGHQRMASRPPAGVCLMALCSRLRVSSRSIQSWAARVRARSDVEVEVALPAISGDRSSATARTTSSSRGHGRRLLAQLLHLGQRQHLVGQLGGAVDRVVDLGQRLARRTSPRRADCTWAFSTASGVRNWCEASRTKRFWWPAGAAGGHHLCWWRRSAAAARAARRARRWAQVALGRALQLAALSSRTGRVARCTTTTTSGESAPSAAPGATACRPQDLRASVSAQLQRFGHLDGGHARPVLATGCSSTAMRTGSPRNCRRRKSTSAA
jgi:hypothetical protein